MFNPSKSSLIVHTPNGPLSTSVIFNGELIQSEKNAIHLGNIVGYIREEERMSKCVGEFYGKVNLLLSQFGSVNENIRYSLFKTYCMPLYGCQLWDMSSRSMNLLFTAWRKCVRRIWKVHPMTHCNLLHLICNDLPVEQQIHKRFLKFLFSILESKNKIIYLCGQLALCGSQSKLGNSINHLCDIYNIAKYDIKFTPKSQIYKSLARRCEVTDNCIQKAGAIRDFIQYRHHSAIDAREDIETILHYLCTG
jgi:hypothetical protein